MTKLIGPDIARTIINAQNGVARLNRYRVIMPTLFLGGDAITLDVQCRSATIPGRNVTTVPKRTNMKEIQTPTGYQNTPVDMLFTESNNYNVSRYLDEWVGRVVDNNTYQVAYRDDIVRDIVIMSTDEAGIPQYICVLRNAFPKAKTQIDLNDSSENSPVEVRAQFEYEDYHIVDNPVIDGVQDVIQSIQAGRFKVPTNLLRRLPIESAVNRITDGIGGLF